MVYESPKKKKPLEDGATFGANAGAAFLDANANNPANGPTLAPPPKAPFVNEELPRLANAAATAVADSPFAKTRSGFERPGGVSFQDPNAVVKPIGEQLGIPSPGSNITNPRGRAVAAVPGQIADAVSGLVKDVGMGFRFGAGGGSAPAAAPAAPVAGQPVAAPTLAPPAFVPGAPGTPNGPGGPIPQEFKSQARIAAEPDGQPVFPPAGTPAAAPAPAAAPGAPAPAAAPQPTLRSANGTDEGYFIGSNGVRKTVNTDGSINAPGAPAVAAPATAGLAVQPGAVAAPAIATPSLAAPAGFSAPQVNLNGDRAGAENERKVRMQAIKDEIFKLGTLDSRGKRAMYAQLQGELGNLTGKRFDQAGQLDQTAAQLANQGGIAALGANASAAEGAANRDANAKEATLKRNFELENGGEVTTGADGTGFRLRGGKAEQITGPDGQPFKPAPTKAETSGQIGDKDRLDALNKEREQAASAALTPEQASAALAAYDASPAGQKRIAYLNGQDAKTDAQGSVPAGYTQVGTKDGKPVYRDAAGQTFIGE